MKINKYLLVFVLTFGSFFAHAQQISLESAAQLVQSVNAGDCMVRTSCYDPEGNILLAGDFTYTVDFDPGVGVTTLSAYGSSSMWTEDIFILKLSAAGEFIWVKRIGNTSSNTVGDMVCDTSGNIILTGRLYQTIDFDPGAGTYNLTSDVGWDNVFLLKLTAAGDFVWAKKTSGANAEAGGNQLAFDAAGNILVGGKFWGTEDFDMSNATYNLTAVGTQAFLMKVTPSGVFMWVKCFGESGNVYPISEMLVDENYDIVLCGTVEETSDFDPGPGTHIITPVNGVEDAYILKLDANGGFLWAGSMGGSQGDRGGHMKLDPQGNILMGFKFYNSADVDPTAGVFTLSTPSTTGNALVKISGSGDFIWGKSVGCFGTINQDASGNIYVAGAFQATRDFDPGPGIYNLSSVGANTDLSMFKLDANGNFRWAVKGGETSGTDVFTTCIPGSGNTWLTTGYFFASSDIDLGPGTYTVNGMNDYNIFLATYSECETDTLITASACTAYTLNGQTYTTEGTFIQVIPNAAGCDSLITFQLKLLADEQVIDVIACDSFVFNGITYTTAGTYTSVYTNMAGCDSTVTLNLTFGQPSQSILNETACGSYMLNGQTYTTGGTYTQTIPNYAGCDSTITLNLTVLQPSQSTISETACGSYNLNGTTYSTSGTYTSVIPNAVGCDSTITLNLTILQETGSVWTVSSCNNYLFNGVTYGSTGTYLQNYVNAAGCDSIVTLHLTITQPSESELTETACGSYTLGGMTFTANGTYTVFLTNAQGCDSTVTLHLTIVQPSQSVLDVTSCEYYVLDGMTYTENGTHTVVIPNTQGCDSTITLNLTITQPTQSVLNVTSCEHYILDGVTYTESGTHTVIIPNAQGCDSTITLNLTIQSSQSVLNETACYSYILNGTTYTESGTYTSVVPNAAGCDSTITLVLTISESTTGSQTVWANGQYVWPANGIVYTTSGTYTAVLVNAAGCDSLVTLTLEILLGVDEQAGFDLALYPNPASEQVRITFPAANGIITINDVSGKLISTRVVQSGDVIAVDQFEPGVYFFSLTSGGNTATRKVLKMGN